MKDERHYLDLTTAPSRVLVVDDEAVSSFVARLLSGEGYTVETATNFAGAPPSRLRRFGETGCN